MEPSPPQTIHYTELEPAQPGLRFAEEWETYRREVARLLAEGHEGKYALIQCQKILSIYDTEHEVWNAASQLYPQTGVIRHILTYEPMIRLSHRQQQWLASNSPLRRTA